MWYVEDQSDVRHPPLLLFASSRVRDPPDKGDNRKSFVLFRVVRVGFAVG